ncbi:MAG: imidazole glycerol-phosphate synthase subunit HisF [Actinomycetota bacterium]|jgi:very-short-patch-repair endonuclease|nr:imidazole glycerol-phosphate synthase subunit HisF [Actinomycetota bacterium]
MGSGDSGNDVDRRLHLFPLEILNIWQRAHGALDIQSQELFLGNPILSDIGRYRRDSVEDAIQRRAKLTEILALLVAAHPPVLSVHSQSSEVGYRRAWKNEKAEQRRLSPSPPESILWEHLHDGKLGGFRFIREYEILGWFADFYCPERRLVIEVDGRQHRYRREEDRARDLAMRRAGFRVRRFTAHRVTRYTPRVVNEIRTALGLDPEPLPGEHWDSSKLWEVVMRHQAIVRRRDSQRAEGDSDDGSEP